MHCLCLCSKYLPWSLLITMSSTDINWLPRLRRYEQEKKLLSPSLQDSNDSHPLRSIVTTVESTKAKTVKSRKDTKEVPPSVVEDPLSSSSASVLVDPLSLPAASDPLSAALLDPLSLAAAETIVDTRNFGAKPEKDVISAQVAMEAGFEPWTLKRTAILSNYTTSESIPITTSFLSEEERTKLETKAQAAAGDKVKNRLEQLDDLEDGSIKETLNLSQKDYVKKIDDLNRALVAAWDNDQRVKALKIAIQCAKLLSDTSVIQFYPSKFVLITDILDNFGFLVFDRIRRKSQYLAPGAMKPVMLPENFTSDQVPESGKETCRNWFYKIASIRELLPRFYVETAILKCYSYLTNREYTQALIRLTRMIRGIGDPLVACYARAYLCRVGMTVAPDTKNHLMPNFKDYLKTVKQVVTDHVQNTLAVQHLDLQAYMLLYVPAVDWIMQCISHNASEHQLEEVITTMKEGVVSAPVLNAVISNFKPEFISERALLFADMIKDCEETGLPKYKLLTSMGHCVVSADPPLKDRRPLLNSVWKSVVKMQNPSEYIACTQVWIEYVAKHFSKKEVNTLLDDIIKHLTPDRAFESHYSDLMSVISRIVTHMTDYNHVFSMDKFLPFIDLFQKEDVKVEVCKTVVGSFTMHQTEDTNDPLIVNGVMYLCRIIHDALNSLSLEDHRRQAGNLVCGFIQKISFSHDFEQQLNFYVDVRANFSNLDQVLSFLIHNVNRLAMETRRLVKCNHSRKTAAFVRACAAFCFITIPSFESKLTAMNLYLLCGSVAIANGALSQGDAFFKAAINTMKDVPQYIDIDRKHQPTEIFMSEFISKFLSTLLVVPDNPDHEVLFMLKGLLNGMLEYKWPEKSDRKMRVYLNAIPLISAYCQDKYLYGIVKVDSNDSLYAGDSKFVSKAAVLVNTIINQILEHLKSLSHPEENYKRQAIVSLGLFVRLIAHCDITEGTNIVPLLVNLWNLTQKHSVMDPKLMVRVRLSVKNRAGSDYRALAEKLT